ncbi:chromosomal protein D1 [Chanos chanos]|uniref:Chromosomal protein D1 n=1 Tax=Chanos chanos TaxID=29144 RepID=A0A6J2WLW2_CHACN|nr:chromosomal protein D1-like [Chanos chanos]
MEVEQKDISEDAPPKGNSHAPKRGRGRPRGAVAKKPTIVMVPYKRARVSKTVDLFSPDTVLMTKVRKRGRPKKNKVRGRPRKTPLTPEQEAERSLKRGQVRRRKLSKPLGRPRIHPRVDPSDVPKERRGRGRPRKYPPNPDVPLQKSLTSGGKKGHPPKVVDGVPRKRGRPLGSVKKKRGRQPGSAAVTQAIDNTPRKRGRPLGSGGPTKVTVPTTTDGEPRKRGRPRGSGAAPKQAPVDGVPRKRGRPPGSGASTKVPPQTQNGVPRKRGRPPGSGKAKVAVKEPSSDNDPGSAPTSNAEPRKRGRPLGSTKAKKAAMKLAASAITVTEQTESGDLPPAKRPKVSETQWTAPVESLSDNEADDGDRESANHQQAVSRGSAAVGEEQTGAKGQGEAASTNSQEEDARMNAAEEEEEVPVIKQGGSSKKSASSRASSGKTKSRQ